MLPDIFLFINVSLFLIVGLFILSKNISLSSTNMLVRCHKCFIQRLSNAILIENFLLFSPSLFFCRDHLENYTSDYTAQVLVGYCMVYIFMQTFMIPGTVFMSLLAGSLFGVFKGVALVVFTATAGASSCYFLSKLIGRPILSSIWPNKLKLFQAQVNLNSLSNCFWLSLLLKLE